MWITSSHENSSPITDLVEDIREYKTDSISDIGGVVYSIYKIHLCKISNEVLIEAV